MGGWQYLKTANQRRAVGKSLAPLDKKLQNVEWGEKIYLKDLFEIKRGKRLTVEKRISGDRPLVTAGYENTGVAEYISNPDQEIFPADTITIDMFANVFYRNYCYSADDNILILFEKIKISSKVKLFIANLISKVLSNKFTYGKQYRMGSFEQTKIKLPSKNGEIDFAFMESFIAELEAERIAELEAYLVASGLKDYTLTKEEQKVLAEFEDEKIQWGEFKVGGNEGLCMVSTVKSFDEGRLSLVNQKQEDCFEFVGRTRSNNGVKGYTQELNIKPNSDGVISVSQIGTVVAQLRKEKWYASQNIFSLTPKEGHEKLISLYGVTAVDVALGGSFSDGYSNYPTLKTLKKLLISLPVQNDQPDYEKMETFISAIQKLVIKDVVQYADRNIAATKQVVRNNT